MEVGAYNNGFYRGIAKIDQKTRSYMGDYGSFDPHILSVSTTDMIESLSWQYIQEIVRLPGVPISIVSDWYPSFISQFWKSLQTTLETNLCLSTAFHPHMDNQLE